MPVYTYHCDCCGLEFDKKQDFYDENLTQCPNCAEGCLRRVYKPARVVFKGSGFYVTDNKSSRRLLRSPGDNHTHESKEKTDTKTEAKSETKSETKTEKKKEPAEKK